MEYSKRKESERSDNNSERSDRVKGAQRCERDIQRCKKRYAHKKKKVCIQKMAIDPLDKPLPCLKIWSTDPSKT